MSPALVGILGVALILAFSDPLRARMWAAALVAGAVLIGAGVLIGAMS